MSVPVRFKLGEIEGLVCDIASAELGFPRHQVSPKSSLVDDLGCDSLDLVELIMKIEERFAVTLPNEVPNPVYKTIFTRSPFRLSDLAELVYIRQGTGSHEKHEREHSSSRSSSICFTQLDGRWEVGDGRRQPLMERLNADGRQKQYRRRSDGMRCVRLPSASVEIGCDAADGLNDERPKHLVHLDAFLIDAEPVSTTAYCRFLNSINGVSRTVLGEWFVLEPGDDREEHVLVTRCGDEWRPVPGCERWPMILVSWFGANAYSLWANGEDWKQYRDDSTSTGLSFLPTEAQWEYAARGARYQHYPWGDSPPKPELLRYECHRPGANYRVEALPLAAVNEVLGMSPFGLHHMAGNVWQWCRDNYSPDFYRRAEASAPNPVNRTSTPIRSERGGSWVGPAELCRSSYRRGRVPLARGRCLGFRCVSSIPEV